MTTMLWLCGSAFAADHIEAPLAAADPAADISDFYAWHTDDHLITVLNFAGFGAAGEGAMYDEGMLYGIHIDNTGDSIADTNIWVRFGADSLGNWGVQVENMPGTGAPVAGPVESVIVAPGGQVFAGLREDPFRFDFTGFGATLTSGQLAFNANPNFDDFAGSNVTSIVLRMDAGAAAQGATDLNLWATTARDNN